MPQPQWSRPAVAIMFWLTLCRGWHGLIICSQFAFSRSYYCHLWVAGAFSCNLRMTVWIGLIGQPLGFLGPHSDDQAAVLDMQSPSVRQKKGEACSTWEPKKCPHGRLSAGSLWLPSRIPLSTSAKKEQHRFHPACASVSLLDIKNGENISFTSTPIN